MALPTKFPDNASWGDLLGPAMKITEQSDADRYFEVLVQHGLRRAPELDRATVESNLRQSLGYFAGYSDHETRIRVERLFNCCHPVFGKAGDKPVSSKKAFELGVELGVELGSKHRDQR